MAPIEGVDYSATAHGDWQRLARALTASGKLFAGRYAVNDKSPGGRGITAAEYQALRAAGVEVFVYWQTTTSWMLGGFDAGVQGARNARANLLAAGMPATMPVYFACDFDAAPGHQAVIDDCLRGAASVLGAKRVGLYGGYHVLKRAMANQSAAWFCQTSAWSGGMILDGIHLYQYAYNQYIDGTNCDSVRAYRPNYGQASRFAQPIPAPLPEPEPIWWEADDVGPQRSNAGAVVYALRGEVTARRNVPLYTRVGSGLVAHRLKQGERAIIRGTYVQPIDGKRPVRWAFVEWAPGKIGRARLSAFGPGYPTL